MTPDTLQARLTEMRDRSDELVTLASDLVHFDTQNLPPGGNEGNAQPFVQEWLCSNGMDARLIDLTEIRELADHPLYFPGRDYTGRPNIAARLAGSGSGKSLLFTGHIDTMPAAPGHWNHPPCEPCIEEERLFGLGAFDMKGGVAAAMWTLGLLHEWGLVPGADILLETVVDEEHAGANGTLANRLIGHHADGAILPEPSGLNLYSAHKGFRIIHLVLRGTAGMSFSGETVVNPVEAMGTLIGILREFGQLRRQTAPIPVIYRDAPDPVPVMLPKLQAGEFSYRIPMQIPETCRIEMYWQTMPGENQKDIEQQFFDFLHKRLAESDWFDGIAVEHEFVLRWMPGTATDAQHPFVQTVSTSACEVLGVPVSAAGAPYPCDLFVLNAFDIPGVVLGPAGQNAHAPNEYVEIESLVTLCQSFLTTIHHWCGWQE